MNQSSFNKILSQNLRAIRKRKGLTTTDLAKILGVSQAKVSYIENSKGVLSAEDVAILSRKLNVPVTEFFRGLDSTVEVSNRQQLVSWLVQYGAVLLAKPTGIVLKEIPFEDVVNEALGFIEDDRIFKGFCVALISQAASSEINIDRIFALIGSNAFLVVRFREVVWSCIKVIRELNGKGKSISPRAERQLRKALDTANQLVHLGFLGQTRTLNEAGSNREENADIRIKDIASFVEESLDAKR
jgi:transcriptional regulator with XRE-family HTH domain